MRAVAPWRKIFLSENYALNLAALYTTYFYFPTCGPQTRLVSRLRPSNKKGWTPAKFRVLNVHFPSYSEVLFICHIFKLIFLLRWPI